MRISTSMFYRQGTTAIQESQSNLVRTQLQLSSGERVLTSADDPVAASRLLELDAVAARTEQYQRNGIRARNRLATQEQALTDVQNVLFRVRDLAIQANSDTLDATTRGYIASEVDENLNQLVQLANTRDADGNFLFSGFKSDTQPFARLTTGVRYDGDQGERRIQISDTRSVVDGDSGDGIFMSIRNGTGVFSVSANSANSGTGVIGTRSLNDPAVWDNSSYTVRFTADDAYEVVNSGGATIAVGAYETGETVDVQGVGLVITGAPAVGDEFTVEPSQDQDMFTTVQNFIDAVTAETGEVGIARLHNSVGNALENLDRSIENVLDFRTRVGTRLQAIDAQEATNADFSVTLAATQSQLRDLDYAEAVTRLNQQLVGLEAAQQSFARIQGLSLFNLI